MDSKTNDKQSSNKDSTSNNDVLVSLINLYYLSLAVLSKING